MNPPASKSASAATDNAADNRQKIAQALPNHASPLKAPGRAYQHLGQQDRAPGSTQSLREIQVFIPGLFIEPAQRLKDLAPHK